MDPLLVIVLLGMQAPDPMEKIQAAMTRSLERQRASIERQTRAAVPAAWASAPTTSPASGGSDCPVLPASQVDGFVRQAAEREGFTPDLLRAVIQRESGFRPCAVSVKGAQGLMQLMPATAETFGVTDAFDARQNIDAGSRFLRYLLDRYSGDLSLALGAYNAGPGRVDQYQGIPPFPETQGYVRGILDNLAASAR